MRHVLGLLSAEAFVADAAGHVSWSSGDCDSGVAPQGSVHDLFGVTPEQLARVLSGGAEQGVFERDGEHYEVKLCALREAGGGASGALGVVVPASERVRLERALAACELRLRQVVDSNMLGILFWERDGRISGANDAFLQLVGYTREDLTAGRLSWKMLTPREYWAADEAALAEIDRGAPCVPFEKEYVRKDGRRIPVLIGGATFDARNTCGVCFVIDESERKQHERRRRDAEAQLRHAVNCTPFVLWSVDAEGVFTVSEGRGLSALGLSPGQVVGQSAFEFYKDSPEVLEALRRGLSGDDFTHTVELGGRTFETRTFQLTDAAGQGAGLVALSLDITERQRAEAERMRLQAKLLEVQRLESLGLMAGGIAHDFNNILTVILGNASTARLSLPEQAEARADIDSVIAAGHRAAELTRQMLAYSGRGRVEVRPIDLSSLVRDIAGLLGTTLSRTVELQLELGSVPAVKGDPAQLQQVIMSLLINGVEACGDSPGLVVVRTGEQPPGESDRASGGGPGAGRYVSLEVQDDGCGMDAATVGKIFDPFFTTKFTGRGLGLAAVLGIVRAHQGVIEVDSAPGRGSRFKVLLPSCDEVALAPARPPRELRGHRRVLVIDDDVGVRQIVGKMLASLGLSVLEAGSGRAGLGLLEQRAGELDLVLLDLTMPDMDGEETLRTLRGASALPVVLMSGYGESEAMFRFAAHRLAGFLQKPFTAQQLGEVLSQALEPDGAPVG